MTNAFRVIMLIPMLAVAKDNLDLLWYLVTQVLSTRGGRFASGGTSSMASASITRRRAGRLRGGAVVEAWRRPGRVLITGKAKDVLSNPEMAALYFGGTVQPTAAH